VVSLVGRIVDEALPSQVGHAQRRPALFSSRGGLGFS
jgi:hypothetical protein